MAGTKGAVVRDSQDNYEVINGTAGHVLTSNGVGNAPSFQATGSSYTDEQAQDAIGTILSDAGDIDFTYDDGTPAISAVVKSDAITFDKMQNIATDSLLGRDTAGTGDVQNILLNATLSMDGSGNLQRAALTGDVTAAAGSNATTIANDAVSNAKAADMAAWTVKARNNSGSGDPQDVALADLTEDESPGSGDYALGFSSGGELRKFNFANVVGGGGGHVHGLMRILGDGATTTFNLLDLAEYLEHVGVNGAFVDPATFTLSADRSQITFDAAPGDGQVVTMEYVIAGL